MVADAMMQCNSKHKGQRKPICKEKGKNKNRVLPEKKMRGTQEERKNVVYLVGGCMACI